MEQLSNYRRFARIINKIGVYYKFLFWKLENEDGVFTVKSRSWAHSLKDILLFPVWLIAAFCAGLVSTFEATAYERKLHVPRSAGKFSKKQLRAIKFHLLASFTVICMIMSSCGSLDPVTRTASYQQPREHPAWLKSQSTLWEGLFGKRDPRIKQAEAELATNQRLLKEQEKEEQILQKVESIKSKIK